MSMDLNKIYFSEPRLEFSPFLRFLWRLIYFSFYIIFAIASVLFVAFEIIWLKWVGALFLLFLANRFIHLNKPLHSLNELNQETISGADAMDYLLPRVFHTIEKSYDRTIIVGGDFHLNLMQLLMKNKGIRGALWRLEVSPEEFEQKLDEEISKSRKEIKENQKQVFEKTSLLIKNAFLEAFFENSDYIDVSHIFSSLGHIGGESVKKIFYMFSIDADDLNKALIFSRYRYKTWISKLPETIGGFVISPKNRHRIMNRSWTARPTPVLDSFSIDFTDLARDRKTGFLVGHEKEYKQMVDVLSRPTRPNVLLVGDPGSGSDALVHHLASEIVRDEIPEALFDKRLVGLQISSLISNADPQEVSRRVNKVIDEIMTAGNVILFIPDIYNLVRTSGDHYMNAADIILPAIKTDAFSVVGSAYYRDFKQDIEPRSDFMNAFDVIKVDELSEDESIRFLAYDSLLLENQYKVIISFEAIKQAVVLAHKYFRRKLLPSSAEDLLKEALAYATQKGDNVLKSDHIIAVSERKVNIPIHKTTREEAEKLLNLENVIHEDLIDQEEAVKAVSGSLREYRSGLGRSSGPIAAFLFVGPTGVGKTELAKTLAKTQFGSFDAMIRFDMSEYQDKQSVFRFIGSPDGKVTGSLTEAVIQKPYCLILLDEFEKANSDVLNLFLQVFDDGRLTDNSGRVVDFKNTIIIATSNANSDYIKDQLEQGKSISEIKEDFKKKLTASFKPELLNRFSDVIIFKNLSIEDTVQIARLQLDNLVKTLEENQGINLQFNDELVNYVARIGYDPVFGARPLRGVVSDKIKSVLADKILRGEINKGKSVLLKLENNEIKFTDSAAALS